MKPIATRTTMTDKYVEIYPIPKQIDDERTRNLIHDENVRWLKLKGYTNVVGELLYDIFDEQWISKVTGSPPVMSRRNDD